MTAMDPVKIAHGNGRAARRIGQTLPVTVNLHLSPDRRGKPR
jgi:hypothetical protein